MADDDHPSSPTDQTLNENAPSSPDPGQDFQHSEENVPQSPERGYNSEDDANAPQSPDAENPVYEADEPKSPSSEQIIDNTADEDPMRDTPEDNEEQQEVGETPVSPEFSSKDLNVYVPNQIKEKSAQVEHAREEESTSPSADKRRIVMDSDDEEGPKSDDEEKSRKRRAIVSDDSDVEDGGKVAKSSTMFGDDSDDDDNNRGQRPLDHQEGDEFAEPDEVGENQEGQVARDDDSDEGVEDGGSSSRRGGFEYDFDVMMRQKKAERKRRVRRKDGGIDIINDDDGIVSKLVERMKNAAKLDRQANMDRRPAIHKMKMLPEVKTVLVRAGLFEALVENGFMSALSEWLAPLPDKCLPALDIRVTVLKLLHNPRFWKLDGSTLKHSGLGKAVMLLYKHPNETRENKMIANKLIGEWARPIFNLDTDYSSMSKEERVQRDYERMPAVKKKKLDVDKEREEVEERRERRIATDTRIDVKSRKSATAGELKPGDKGYINRARVPKPSTRDYVVRPKWNVEGEFKGERKSRGNARYDQAYREFQERTRKSNASRAVKVSLEGRNMAL